MDTIAQNANRGLWRKDSLAALALGLLLSAGWVASEILDKRDLESRVRALLQELEHKMPMAINLGALKSQRSDLESMLTVSQREFPTRFDADLLQDELARRAGGPGLEIIDLTRGEETQREHHGELDFEITLRGGSSFVYSFLESLLTKSLPINHLSALDLRSERVDTDVVTAKFRVVYFRSVGLHEESHASAR